MKHLIKWNTEHGRGYQIIEADSEDEALEIAKWEWNKKPQLTTSVATEDDCCIDVGTRALERIAELEEQLANAKNPNMFWDAENPDECQFDVRDVFESYFCESTEVGLQVVIQQAVSVPNATYQLIELNDNGTFEIEEQLEGKG